MTRGASIVALILIAHLPSLDGQKPEVAGSEPTFRTEVDLLSVAVRVTDRKDNEIHGLTADRFSLYEDGILQKISFFAAEEESVSPGDPAGCEQQHGVDRKTRSRHSRAIPPDQHYAPRR
jgi:hypothetical protein